MAEASRIWINARCHFVAALAYIELYSTEHTSHMACPLQATPSRLTAWTDIKCVATLSSKEIYVHTVQITGSYLVLNILSEC
jgi:hypothetical protein